MNEEENKKVLSESMGKVMDLLKGNSVCEAAGEFVSGFEEYLSRRGVPPAQVCYAALVPSRTQGEQLEIEEGITLVPSIDVSAQFNGIPEDIQKAVLHVTEKHIKSIDLLFGLWGAIGEDSKAISIKADQFKIAVATVSFIRQWCLHFADHTSGPANPHATEQPDDLCCFDMFTLVEQIRESMRGCGYFSGLLDYLMEDPDKNE